MQQLESVPDFPTAKLLRNAGDYSARKKLCSDHPA